MGIATIAISSGIVIDSLYWMQELLWPWTVWLISFPILAGVSLYLWYVSAKRGKWNLNNGEL
jgi:membrane protein implicated in regulation of membrane protease activity